MKTMGFLTVACVCLCAAAFANAQSVAVVDLDALVQSHPNTISDKKLLDQTVKDFRAENDDLRQKLEGMQEDFEKIRKEAADPALSEKARKAAEERFLKARDALVAADRTAREKMQSRQEQLTEMQTRMLKKTINEIREVVAKYADGRKIQLVLPANQVVYNEKTLDITDAIMKQMDIMPRAATPMPALAPAVTPVTPPVAAPAPAAAAPVAAPLVAPAKPLK